LYLYLSITAPFLLLSHFLSSCPLIPACLTLEGERSGYQPLLVLSRSCQRIETGEIGDFLGLGLGVVAWGIVRRAEETTAMKDSLGLAFGVEGFGARRFGWYVYTRVYVYDGPGPGVSAGRVVASKEFLPHKLLV